MMIHDRDRAPVDALVAALAGDGEALMSVILGMDRRARARLMNALDGIKEMNIRTTRFTVMSGRGRD